MTRKPLFGMAQAILLGIFVAASSAHAQSRKSMEDARKDIEEARSLPDVPPGILPRSNRRGKGARVVYPPDQGKGIEQARKLPAAPPGILPRSNQRGKGARIVLRAIVARISVG